MDIIKLAKAEEATLIAYRRQLHEHPELSGQEYQTLAFIKARLTEYGIPLVQVAHGGIIATIDSGHPGQTVMLRADMDALPITESPVNAGGQPKPCVSKVAGVQHACGHDAHTAALLIAGKIINAHKTEFAGRIVLCFEQGEEANGNIFYLLKYFEAHNMRFDSCLGIHVGGFAEGAPGALIFKAGPFMAGMLGFKITLSGKGGHGSRPDLANSPITCFSAIDQALAALRLIKADPFGTLAYSIGYVKAGNKNNIIPDQLQFGGSLRYFDQPLADAFWQTMQKTMETIAELHGCKLTYDEVIYPGYPVNNDPYATAIAKAAFSELFDDVIAGDPLMSTESFAFYQQKFPGVFVDLCTQNQAKGITGGNHSPEFDVDEAVLYKAVVSHVAYAYAFLQAPKRSTPYAADPRPIDAILAACGRKIEDIE